MNSTLLPSAIYLSTKHVWNACPWAKHCARSLWGRKDDKGIPLSSKNFQFISQTTEIHAQLNIDPEWEKNKD